MLNVYEEKALFACLVEGKGNTILIDWAIHIHLLLINKSNPFI